MLSFVDVMSCGLGAAILLFLVYAMRLDAGAASAAARSGGSPRGTERRGSFEDENGTGTALGARMLLTSTVLGPEQIVWEGVPAGCEQQIEQRGATTMVGVLCPVGFAPDAVVGLGLGASTTVTEVTVIDGARWATCTVSLVMTPDQRIVFRAGADASIRLEPEGTEVSCSALAP